MNTTLSGLFYRFAPAWLVNIVLNFKLSTLDKSRIAEVKKWVDCAAALAESTGYMHAKEIATFLCEEGFAASPLTNGFKSIQAKDKMTLPIMVLLFDDYNVGGMWQSQYEMSDGCMAAFIRTNGESRFEILCLRGQVETSDFAKGLLCLHEGKHAWHFFHKKVSANEEERFLEELEILEFECRLFELYFGSSYSSFIDSEAERIAALSKKGKNPVEQAWFYKTFEEFGRRFKKYTDDRERNLFYTILCYAVMFRYLRDYGSGDLRLDKVRFVIHTAKRTPRK